MKRSLDPRTWSLARQVIVLQLVVITVLVAGGVGGALLQAQRANEDAAERRVLAVARTIADQPAVRDALRLADPSAPLQPIADRVCRDTDADFVVIMTTGGVRYTHPNPRQIGGTFLGNIGRAARGEAFTETYTGTLGPSVRAVVPIRDTNGDGPVVGLVSVGITLEAIGRGVRAQVPPLLGAAGAALLLAIIGSGLVGRRLRRQTHDLGPAELARMYEFYDAVLHAVREGLLLLDRRGRLQLANDEAVRLLGLPDGVLGRPVDGLGLPEALGRALAEGRERTDEIHLTGDRVVVVNQALARWRGAPLGTVVTLRDHTDLQALTGELDSVRGFAESLRAQAHEASNRLHTVVSLIELGRPEEALEFAAAELGAAQQLTDLVVGSVREPVLAALLLGKAARAAERGVELSVDATADVPAGAIAARDLVTIVGNLLDNAIDAAVAAPAPRRVEFSVRRDGDELVLRVADTGPGLDRADLERAFHRGWSTKPDEHGIGRGLGLALVGQAVRRHGGRVDASGAAFTVRLPVPAGVS